MNSVVTYPDGTQLSTTALTVNDAETSFQVAVAQLLGLLTGTNILDISIINNSNIAQATSVLGLYIGLQVVGPGIPANTFINGIGSLIDPLQVFISNKATATAAIQAVISDPTVWYKSRVGWQTKGEPAPPIDDDTVTVICKAIDNEYSRLHDNIWVPTSGNFVKMVDVFTVTWRTSWIFYGPNSWKNARLVKSGLLKAPFIDALLAQSNLYVNPSIEEPQRVPEKRQGQWWERVDLVAEFNEQVTETITIGTVRSVEVQVFTKDGKILDTTVTGS